MLRVRPVSSVGRRSRPPEASIAQHHGRSRGGLLGPTFERAILRVFGAMTTNYEERNNRLSAIKTWGRMSCAAMRGVLSRGLSQASS